VEVVMTSPAQSIDELVLPLVSAAGLELWDVEVNPQMVRVLVDRPGGIDLDAVAEVARAVSAALDERDDLAPSSNYQLEVSSPGVERTLRTPSHFRRYVATLVAVKTVTPVEGSRRLQATLLACDDEGITLALEQGATQLRYEQIQKARAVLVWGPAAKRSAAKSSAGKSKAAASERIKDVAR
jgi:ribosome maturation factor RimP